ncbi:MAG TPA: hypothetical protein VMF58_09470 [Rhizomicrobium sp.]|nr:hypothetical protein [Rhizomicrobium sp.]
MNRAASYLTLIAIACCAYLAADLAHETLGHGGACVASGGKSLLVDTTFQDCSIHSRWIDGAGPVTGIVVALLAWFGARRTRAANLRMFLTLLFADAIFWNVAYMIKSGIGHTGDWHFLIEGLEPASIWHIGLAIAGVALYIGAMRMLARIWPAGEEMTSGKVAVIAYLTAAALSAVAGYFDPRGPHIVLSDALPSSLAAIGLPLVGLRKNTQVSVTPSPVWIAMGVACAIFFIAILGPGIRF